MAARGWDDFLLALDERALASIEGKGLDAVWPHHTPKTLIDFGAEARAVCALPTLNPAPSVIRPRRGETPRKRAQVDAFIRAMAPMAHRAARIVDVGSGHGHLTRDLSERLGQRVIGLERDVALARRARELSPTPSPEFTVTDVLRDGLALEPGDLVVGLHACGELGDAMVTEAARATASVALVGCCLQKRRTALRSPLRPVDGTGDRLELPREVLGLSNLTARDVGAEATREENLAARTRRLALHRLLCEHFGPIPLGAELEGLNRRAAHADLATLAGRAFSRRNTPPPPATAIAHAERWAAVEHARMRRLGLPRALVARALEVYALRDRATYLAERGFETWAGVLFTQNVSPRNLALLAAPVG